MPIPQALQSMIINKSAAPCNNFPLAFQNPHQVVIGRAQITRTFHVYLEIAMQAKHDNLMRTLCINSRVLPRKSGGTQVVHVQAVNVLAPNGFYYQDKAHIAAQVTKSHILARWNQPQLPGQSVFTQDVLVNAGVQHTIQSDNYRYEISYYYDIQDIYVLFHCYPA